MTYGYSPGGGTAVVTSWITSSLADHRCASVRLSLRGRILEVLPMLTLLLISCATSGESTDKADSGATDTADTVDTADSGGDTADTSGDTAPACATVNPGEDWAWSGECPQMATPVVITVEGCTLALDYDAVGGMTMGMPYSATIDGDTVTFADDNGVDGCVGTVETADEITGSCADGCTFKLRR